MPGICQHVACCGSPPVSPISERPISGRWCRNINGSGTPVTCNFTYTLLLESYLRVYNLLIINLELYVKSTIVHYGNDTFSYFSKHHEIIKSYSFKIIHISSIFKEYLCKYLLYISIIGLNLVLVPFT